MIAAKRDLGDLEGLIGADLADHPFPIPYAYLEMVCFWFM